MRSIAAKKAGGELPPSIAAQEDYPPIPPPFTDDSELGDPTVDLSQANMEAEAADFSLGSIGNASVPAADIGEFNAVSDRFG